MTPDGPSPGQRTLRVLIVEDDPDDALLLRGHLLREGYRVESRRVDTREAMATALREERWDVVVSDHSMPRFSALDALEELKRAEIDVPFIIVSGTIGEERAVTAMKAGASDYIVKDHLARLGPAIERELREVAARAARRRAERALRASEAQTRAIVEAAVDGIVTTDEQGVIEKLNPAAERMFGITEAEARGRPFQSLARERIPRLPAPPAGTRSPAWEMTAIRSDGTTFPAEGTRSEVLHEDRLVVTYIVRDVSERKAFEERLAHRANHDALTGLPNRSLFRDRLGLALARSRRTGTRSAVLFLDLDHFKVINDSLGHTAGDRLLVLVAERLAVVLRPEDTLARLGGDEFVILVEGLDGDPDAVAVGERLQGALADPFTLAGADVYVTASIGIAVAGPDATPESAIRDADAAMYRAKARGRARAELFDAEMVEQSVLRLETESALRRGIAAEEFRVAYQPIVDLVTREVVGVEALVRWQHPERGLLMPGDFIALAEDTGLIAQLGEIVLRSACLQARRWGARAERPLSVSVNLSGRQLAAPGLVRMVTDGLEATGLDPSLLCLEITESVLMSDVETAMTALADLRTLGVRLAVDDFGTGYSALAYLKHFPVDQLKIDRSFIIGLGEDPRDAAIVSSVLALADALGLAAVAEGVETAGQEQQLRDLGCRCAQGFRFARPALPEEAEPALAWVGS